MKKMKYFIGVIFFILLLNIIAYIYVQSNNIESTRFATYPLIPILLFPIFGFLLGMILNVMNIVIDNRKIDLIGSFKNFKLSPLFILALILFAISIVPHDIYFIEFKLFKGGIFKRIFLGPLQHQIVHFVISTIAGFIVAKISIKSQD